MRCDELPIEIHSVSVLICVQVKSLGAKMNQEFPLVYTAIDEGIDDTNEVELIF